MLERVPFSAIQGQTVTVSGTTDDLKSGLYVVLLPQDDFASRFMIF